MTLKERYRAIQAWQRQTPFNYSLKSTETFHCANCGHDFTGNFCPYCSQKAGTGRMTWQSVWRGVMDIWAMGGRSMPYSIFQLMARPGYFIADYIRGKHMTSFPPVKMLFVLAVIVGIIEHWCFPETATPEVAAAVSDTDDDILTSVIRTGADWVDQNKGWGMLMRGVLFILPTWLLFRHAPRLPYHTLPEGFFIQVFLGIQILLLTFLSNFTGIFSTLSFLYIVYTYSQLFGYGLWGTLWRLGVLGAVSALAVIAVLVLAIVTFIPDKIFTEDHNISETLWIVVAMVAGIVVLLVGSYFIGRHGMHMRQLMAQAAQRKAESEAGASSDAQVNQPEETLSDSAMSED